MTITEPATILSEEREFFDRSLSEWLGKFPGKVALIKGHELIGTFDTENDALAEGGRLYQLQSFLVRRINPVQPETPALALMLGILRADTQSPSSATSSATSSAQP